MKIISRVATVNRDKCVGCGTCSTHCPTKAITVKRGQSDGTFVPPCQNACPAMVNVPGYVALAKEGRYEDAYRLIRRSNPFPSVCGRICTHPCQTDCSRSHYDAPVAIKDIKRFVADHEFAGDVKHEMPWPKNGKKVGIIGAGPSGLTCAYYLALSGYDVKVYDSAPVAGGVLAFGIPEWRLPKAVIDREVEVIKAAGVELHLLTEIGKDISFEDLKSQNDAIYIATGTQFSRKAGVKGEDMPGVTHGLDFLRDVNIGRNPQVSKNVVVIGGGNTAMDASRTAIRLGAESVTIVYRRREVDMPADPREIMEAKEEGVKLLTLAAPVEFAGDGKVEKVICDRMEIAEKDAKGRRSVKVVQGEKIEVPADTVIVAVSQYSDFPFINKAEVQVTEFGKLVVDENMMSTMPGVFSGGDVVRGSATAITAIADGKNAARNINRFFGISSDINYGSDIEVPYDPEYKFTQDRSAIMPCLPVEERIKGNAEVALGLTEEQVKAEASRCYRCAAKATVDPQYCIDCQMCWEYCPHDAITMEKLPQTRILKHPNPSPEDCEKVIQILHDARMYPDSLLCFCTFTTTLEIIASILDSGARTPEEISRLTGMKGGCNMYCSVPVNRILTAAGYPPAGREDGMYQPLTIDIYDIPTDKTDPVNNLDKYKAMYWNEETFQKKAEAFRQKCKEELSK